MTDKRRYEVDDLAPGGEVLTVYDDDKSSVFAYHHIRIYFSDGTSEAGTTDENGQCKIQTELKPGEVEVEDVELYSPTDDNPFLEDGAEEAEPLEDVQGDVEEPENEREKDGKESDTLVKSITPETAPIDGGTRLKIEGRDFTDDVTAEIGGEEAIDVRATPDGSSIYITTPALDEGAADLVITVPGGEPETHPGAITYVGDLGEAAKAVTASYIIHLTEIRDRSKSLSDSGKLDDDTAAELREEVLSAGKAAHDQIEIRAQATDAEPDDSRIQDAWSVTYPKSNRLADEITSILGESKVLV